MALLAGGDLFFVANFAIAALLNSSESKIQLGEHFTLQGAGVLLLLFAVLVLPFCLSAIWAGRRVAREKAPAVQ